MFQFNNLIFKIYYILFFYTLFSFQNKDNYLNIIIGKINRNEANKILEVGSSCYYYLNKNDIKSNNFIALFQTFLTFKINNKIEYFKYEKFLKKNNYQKAYNEKFFILERTINVLKIENKNFNYGNFEIFDAKSKKLLKVVYYYCECDD